MTDKTLAITVERLLIHCDECHHEFEGNVPDWHNQPCPTCGQGVLITDDDLAAYEVVMTMVAGVNAAVGEVEASNKAVKFTFDTAHLRAARADG